MAEFWNPQVAAAGVVVADVLGQDRAQVLFAGDGHPVGALGPYRAYEAPAQAFILGAWGAMGSVDIPIDCGPARPASQIVGP